MIRASGVFLFTDSLDLVSGAANRALQDIRDAADRNHRNDEEQGNKTHPLFPGEPSDVSTLAATHLISFLLRAPGKEMCADDEEEGNHGSHSFPVIGTFFHVRIGPLHPAFRPVQLNEAVVLV